MVVNLRRPIHIICAALSWVAVGAAVVLVLVVTFGPYDAPQWALLIGSSAVLAALSFLASLSGCERVPEEGCCFLVRRCRRGAVVAWEAQLVICPPWPFSRGVFIKSLPLPHEGGNIRYLNITQAKLG
jgi:hypothetical protein